MTGGLLGGGGGRAAASDVASATSSGNSSALAHAVERACGISPAMGGSSKMSKHAASAARRVRLDRVKARPDISARNDDGT